MDLQLLRTILSTSIKPKLENNGKDKLASVLIILYGEEPLIIMTEKPKHLKFHAGEISFPGGKYDKQDSDLLDTALRETREELGLDVSREQVIGQLEPVTTLNSGFKILPFISIIDDIHLLKTNEEVESVFHIPLWDFLKTMKDDPDPEHNVIQEMYTFEFGGKIVWGASARMLKQLVIRLNL